MSERPKTSQESSVSESLRSLMAGKKGLLAGVAAAGVIMLYLLKGGGVSSPGPGAYSRIHHSSRGISASGARGLVGALYSGAEAATDRGLPASSIAGFMYPSFVAPPIPNGSKPPSINVERRSISPQHAKWAVDGLNSSVTFPEELHFLGNVDRAHNQLLIEEHDRNGFFAVTDVWHWRDPVRGVFVIEIELLELPGEWFDGEIPLDADSVVPILLTHVEGARHESMFY